MLDTHKYLSGLYKRKPMLYLLFTGNADIVRSSTNIIYSDYDKEVLKSCNIKE